MKKNTYPNSSLSDKVITLPKEPGVYLFKDRSNQIIYIGKLKSLKDRVRSYFHHSNNRSSKLSRLVSQIADIEHIVTGSELEALLLESKLIKNHLPLFNRQQRNFKNYVFIKIDFYEEFPKLYVTHVVKPDGGEYFGPFRKSLIVREVVDTINETFLLPKCSFKISEARSVGMSCVYNHINRCLAPCVDKIDQKRYREIIREVISVFKGHGETLTGLLREKMQVAATQLDFERATKLRDKIINLEKVILNQKVLTNATADNNLIVLCNSVIEIRCELFFIYQGRFLGQEQICVNGSSKGTMLKCLKSIIGKYYLNKSFDQIPVISKSEVDEMMIISNWLHRHKENTNVIQVEKRWNDSGYVHSLANEIVNRLEIN